MYGVTILLHGEEVGYIGYDGWMWHAFSRVDCERKAFYSSYDAGDWLGTLWTAYKGAVR